MPDWLSVLLLGVVEGVTEFLPVSSTGHLLIAERWLPRQTDLFNIVIQCGAVVAVLPLFRERIAKMFRGDTAYLAKLIVAFVITGAGGFAMEKAGLRLPEDLLPIAIAELVVGVLFLVVERMIRGKTAVDDVTWAMAIVIGFAQLVAAAFPGTSRSGACIVALLVMGLARPAATEFTFLVGIPTILAAGGWKIFKALHHPAADAPVENWPMVAFGTVVAAVVSFVAVRWLLRYVQTHTFAAFGYYRIALAGIIFGIIAFS
jgi:undecaprenyl-diphosphatase